MECELESVGIESSPLPPSHREMHRDLRDLRLHVVALGIPRAGTTASPILAWMLVLERHAASRDVESEKPAGLSPGGYVDGGVGVGCSGWPENAFCLVSRSSIVQLGKIMSCRSMRFFMFQLRRLDSRDIGFDVGQRCAP